MSVRFWNEVSLEANKVDHSGPAAPSAGGPGYSSRALAVAHGAMADAFANAATFGGGAPPFPPAFVTLAPTEAVNAAAALGAAAHQTLAATCPRQRAFFDERLNTFVLGLGADPTVAPGLAFGKLVGQAMLNLREDDGAHLYNGADDALYRPGGLPGQHDVDPLNPGQGFLGRRWGLLRPFALTRSEVMDVLPKPPPHIADPDYATDYAEVYAKGVRAGGTRTEEETEIGIFWAYDGAKDIGTPPRLYNQVVRKVGEAETDPLSEAEWVRLFALVNVAMADAGVVAWMAKYVYNVWRPVVGIRHHPETATDGTSHRDSIWEPLGAPRSNDPKMEGLDVTPNFPAYPSGHATFGAACFDTLKAFRAGRDPANGDGNELAAEVEIVSDELNGVTKDSRGNVRPLSPRTYKRVEKMIRENLESRVFLGVHWRFDGVHGVRSGRQIAAKVTERLYAAAVAPAMAK